MENFDEPIEDVEDATVSDISCSPTHRRPSATFDPDAALAQAASLGIESEFLAVRRKLDHALSDFFGDETFRDGAPGSRGLVAEMKQELDKTQRDVSDVLDKTSSDKDSFCPAFVVPEADEDFTFKIKRDFDAAQRKLNDAFSDFFKEAGALTPPPGEDIENAHIELEEGPLPLSTMPVGGFLDEMSSDGSEIQIDPVSSVSSVAYMDEEAQKAVDVTMDTEASDSSYSAMSTDARNSAHEHALDIPGLSRGLGGHRGTMMFPDCFRDPYAPRPGNSEEGDISSINLEKPVEEDPSAHNARSGDGGMLHRMTKSVHRAWSRVATNRTYTDQRHHEEWGGVTPQPQSSFTDSVSTKGTSMLPIGTVESFKNFKAKPIPKDAAADLQSVGGRSEAMTSPGKTDLSSRIEASSSWRLKSGARQALTCVPQSTRRAAQATSPRLAEIRDRMKEGAELGRSRTFLAAHLARTELREGASYGYSTASLRLATMHAKVVTKARDSIREGAAYGYATASAKLQAAAIAVPVTTKASYAMRESVRRVSATTSNSSIHKGAVHAWNGTSKNANDACSRCGITMTKRRWLFLALGVLLAVVAVASAIGPWAFANNGRGDNDNNVDVIQKGRDGEEPEPPQDWDGTREGDGEVVVAVPEPTPSPVAVVSNLSPLVTPIASPSRLTSLTPLPSLSPTSLPSLSPTSLPSLSPTSLQSLSPTLVPSIAPQGSSAIIAMSSRTCDTGNIGDGATIETLRFLYSADTSDMASCTTAYTVPIQLGILNTLETTELLTCRVLGWDVDDDIQKKRREPGGSHEQSSAEAFIRANADVWYNGQFARMELKSFPSVNRTCAPTFPGATFCTFIENVLVFTTDADTDKYGLEAFKEVIPEHINDGTYINANLTSVMGLSYQGILSWDVKDLYHDLYGDASWTGSPSRSPFDMYTPSPSIASMPTEDSTFYPTEVGTPQTTDRAPRTFSLVPTPAATEADRALPTFTMPPAHVATETTPNLASFSFYVMGDVPYNKEQYDKLIDQLKEIKGEFQEHRGQFIVHVGDTMHAGRSKCNENGYAKVRTTMLENSPLPTMVLAGDNDWNDCPEPDKAWKHVQDYYIGIEKDGWENETNALGIQRNESKPEYFAFKKSGVLIVSVHIVGGVMTNNKEWDARIDNGIQWVKDNVWDHNSGIQKLRAVVIFGHGRYSRKNAEFFHGLKEIFMEGMGYRQGLDIPVLYIHGDGHKWWIGSDLSAQLKWDMFRMVMVDKGVAARPLRVHVEGTGGSGYRVERPDQYILGDGLFKLDRRGGLYKRPL